MIGECDIPKSTFLKLGDSELTDFDIFYKGKKSGTLKLKWRCKSKALTDKLASGLNTQFGLVNKLTEAQNQ